MKAIVRVLAAAMLTLGLASQAAAALIFSATLDGGQEVPPVATSAIGTATGMLSGGPGAFVFDYQITYSGLSSVIIPVGGTGGHIHAAPVGVNGPVVHILDQVPFNYTGTTAGVINGQWRYDDPSLALSDVLAQTLAAGNMYINLHTANIPAGELRGQWIPTPAPGTVLLLLLPLFGLVIRRRGSWKLTGRMVSS